MGIQPPLAFRRGNHCLRRDRICAHLRTAPEPGALADLGVDAALVIGEMMKTSLNPAENAQRAAEKYTNYCSLAPRLIPFGLLNKIPATHFSNSVAGMITGSVLLACANLTLPRPTAEWLAGKITEVATRLAKNTERARGHTDDQHAGGDEASSVSPSRIVEIDSPENRV